MYRCMYCKSKFNKPEIMYETDVSGFKTGKAIAVCPVCGKREIEKSESRHCKCCGARLSDANKTDYCNAACRRRGERLWTAQEERKRKKLLSPLSQILKELEEYNKAHKTRLSYGRFIAIKDSL